MKKISYRILALIIGLILVSAYLGLSYAQKLSARNHYSMLSTYCLDYLNKKDDNQLMQKRFCLDAEFAMSKESPLTEGRVTLAKTAFLFTLGLSVLLIIFVMFKERRSSLIYPTKVDFNKTDDVSGNIEEYKKAQIEAEADLVESRKET